ncbi:glutamyl-tRNA amidotransferase [Rhodobacteraceae bacterium B1Z28]|uniref:Glutamyl-tRNA amidotransferase n=1 Tax=Ruegeria haliotis TaxID=2747601 RepID=A0ABX2PS94_9RHOB|nr:amidase family protein [Ruegeria haliotis]NVO57011.1 glutamyl-tRNA amidotransferase [Ruegeria haliotis]
MTLMTAQDTLARAIQRAGREDATDLFLHLGVDAAQNVARRLDATDAAYPLDGAVVILKGNIDIEGLPTTAGTRTFQAQPAPGSAPLVDRIVAAGGVPLGHVNMSEYAYSGLGLNPHFGTPVNGLDADLVPGGSSSGCASAIALGIADLAVGSDTSGSTRVPAAYQGIYGYRPSMGRYDVTGVLPLAPSLDTPGPMAWDIAGIRALDAVLRKVATSRDAKPTRILIPDADSLGPISPQIAALLPQAQAVLEQAGHKVETAPVPVFQHVRELFVREGTLVAAEAPDVLSQFTAFDHPDLDPNVRRRIAQGMPFDPGKLALLQTARAGFQCEMDNLLGDALMLMPTVPAPPPAMSAIVADPDRFASENAKALSLTMLGAFLDLPSLAMPVAGRLPGQSLTLSAATGRDDVLLQVAEAIAQPLLNLETGVAA